MDEKLINKYLGESTGLDSWTKESIKKFSSTIGKNPDEEGFFDACVMEMKGKDGFDSEKAKGFCARVRDKWKGHPMWRGKSKTKEQEEKQGKEWKKKNKEIK